jgi:hypothetical protein
MPTGDEYRVKAAEFLTLAKAENDPRAVAAYQTLAQSYLRLAELADRKKPDLVYETPPQPSHDPIIVSATEPPAVVPPQPAIVVPTKSPIAVPPEIAKEHIEAAENSEREETQPQSLPPKVPE